MGQERYEKINLANKCLEKIFIKNRENKKIFPYANLLLRMKMMLLIKQ